MITYHSLPPSSLAQVLDTGLKCTSRGNKGDDSTIAKTDHFLDAHRPALLIQQGISRDNNLYGYVAADNKIIDIVNGSVVTLGQFIQQTDDIILEITVDEQRCYVSDIDRFDRVKQAIEEHLDQHTLVKLAKEYWDSLQLLAHFHRDDIQRPEIMIPYDVPPSAMRIINA